MVEKVSTLKDGSVRILFESQELDSDNCAKLMGLRRSLGWLIFVDYNAGQIEIPNEPPPEFENQKSLSKRLYDVMFVWWSKLGSNGEFEVFRKSKMEKLIQWVKDQIPE